MKKWPIENDAKELFKTFVQEAIETAKDDLKEWGDINEVYFENGSPLEKFSAKNQTVLLDRLNDAVQGKPFIGMSSTSDYVLEELLYSVVKVHTERSLDMAEETPDSKKSADCIRQVYALDTNTKRKASPKEINEWVQGHIWHDIDWASFTVNPKEYEKIYLSNKSPKGPLKNLPIIKI